MIDSVFEKRGRAMADKIDMEYTIGNHVEFIRTDNDADKINMGMLS